MRIHQDEITYVHTKHMYICIEEYGIICSCLNNNIADGFKIRSKKKGKKFLGNFSEISLNSIFTGGSSASCVALVFCEGAKGIG